MTSAKKKYAFTVFTPTYNRAHTLSRVYESLKSQTFRDFEWLVVDDGSTDETGVLIRKWQAESDFFIRYIWQKNQHKKAAFNRGVREAQGELFLCADSDDSFVSHALERFIWHWYNIPDEIRNQFSGITALCMDEYGYIVGNLFPGHDYFDSNYLETLHKYKLKYERWLLYRTDILKQYPFPTDIEGHVPEGIIWAKIAKEYKCRYINEPLRIYFSGKDQLTRVRNVNKNVNGLFVLNDHILEEEILWFRYNPVYFIKAAINWIRFGWYSKKITKDKLFKKRLSVIAMLIVSIPVSIFIIVRDKR